MLDTVLDSPHPLIETVRVRVCGPHAIVGPVCYAGESQGRLVEIVAAARQPLPDKPFNSIIWYFDVAETATTAGRNVTWRVEHQIQELLAATLRTIFKTVEAYDTQLDFVRAIERHWPCGASTTARERAEADQRCWGERERLRMAYVAKREREGVDKSQALIEFLNQQS